MQRAIPTCGHATDFEVPCPDTSRYFSKSFPYPRQSGNISHPQRIRPELPPILSKKKSNGEGVCCMRIHLPQPWSLPVHRHPGAYQRKRRE